MRRLLPLTIAIALGLALAAPAAAAGPGLTVLAPTPGAQIQGATVTVTFQVSDFQIVPTTVPLSEAGKHPEANRPGQGHVHFMLDLSPLVVWTQAAPYTFTNVPAGDHVLMVELVNNDHSSLSPQVMQMIHFSTAPAMPGTGAGGGTAVPPWLLLFALLSLGVSVVGSRQSAGGVGR